MDSGIYVHVPFCGSKCHYCAFHSRKLLPGIAEAYVGRVAEEWMQRRHEIEGCMVATLYIGGGTPSVLPRRELERLLRLFEPEAYREVTVEANPDDVDDNLCRMLSDNSVNRVSMGVQSLVDSELQAIGRRHDAATAFRAYDMLRHHGFENISLDFIAALPGQTLDTWRRSLTELLAMRPEHVSAYMLSFEPGTLLERRLRQGLVAPVDDDEQGRMFALRLEMLHDAGYDNYEISNSSLPGRRSLHNTGYWDGRPYLGLGPSAASCTPHAGRSINEPQRDGSWQNIAEPETPQERLNDYVMTRLRTREGLSLDTCRRIHGSALTDAVIADARRLIADGRLVEDKGHLLIPQRHWLLADAITTDLMQL